LDKNLQAYVKLYEGKLPVELIDATLQRLKNADWQPHVFYNPIKNEFEARVGDAELDIVWLERDGLVDELMKTTWNVIHEYVKDLNLPWFQGWNGFTEIRFNRYKEQKEMDLHCDHIQSMFDGQRKGIPTLSIVGALNDDYEGGDFVMFEDWAIRIPAGGYLVFPSNFLFPHKVTPVTKGERNTFVSWVW
jgi:hypothetical protein